MWSLDFAILVAAVLVILTIVVQLYAAGQLNQLKREATQYEHAKNQVIELVQDAQQRRTSAVGTRDFWKRRREEFSEEIAAMTGKKVERGEDVDEDWDEDDWEAEIESEEDGTAREAVEEEGAEGGATLDDGETERESSPSDEDGEVELTPLSDEEEEELRN